MTDLKKLLIGAIIGFAATMTALSLMNWAYTEGKASCAQDAGK